MVLVLLVSLAFAMAYLGYKLAVIVEGRYSEYEFTWKFLVFYGWFEKPGRYSRLDSSDFETDPNVVFFVVVQPRSRSARLLVLSSSLLYASSISDKD